MEKQGLVVTLKELTIANNLQYFDCNVNITMSI